MPVLLPLSFVGTLPAYWSSLYALANLNLQGNMLTGTLSPAWSALSSMTYLNLGCATCVFGVNRK